MASADFAPLADALAGDHTVVTYDPRGIAGSTIEDPEQDSTPELRADDVAAILDDLGAESADMFGSSGGAVTGLALVARHPGRVRTLIAHEPPLLELLPDAAQQRANTKDIIDTYRTDGMGVAWFKFMVNAGFSYVDRATPHSRSGAVLKDQTNLPGSSASCRDFGLVRNGFSAPPSTGFLRPRGHRRPKSSNCWLLNEAIDHTIFSAFLPVA